MCDVCLLINDSNDAIKQIMKLFISELNQKENNEISFLVPQAISRISILELALSFDQMKKIIDTIMNEVTKEKQISILIEKLCLKFQTSANPRESRNIAYCLKLINYNEKSLRALLDLYDFWKDKLSIDDVAFEIRAIHDNISRHSKGIPISLVNELRAKLHFVNADQQSLKNYRSKKFVKRLNKNKILSSKNPISRQNSESKLSELVQIKEEEPTEKDVDDNESDVN